MPTIAIHKPDNVADWLRDAILAGEAGLWRWDHRRTTVQLCTGAAHMLAGDHTLAGRELPLDAAFSELHPSDLERLRLIVDTTARGFRSHSRQFHIVFGQAGGRKLLLRGRTQHGAEGEPVATLGVIVDTTEAQAAEDEWFSTLTNDTLDEAAHHGLAAYNAIHATGLASLIAPARELLLAIGREIAAGIKGRRSH
ncbi:hypothetical protein [Methylobacterium aerolatum]|uniref:PAS domain-containing protein n=1 Tax=Methylobacterium aerolatum TaxID=418708 RepID=A0ABU0I556_9HYPH|nr:hypothetical protein [Methylobacterium aerolatum]MDQ0449005.1 hypothetical protein [Methylobacterium aerolatum]GJD35193.1 hypothetical protein FMGBMHLM_2102 [Methylobacterium aerolatum]